MDNFQEIYERMGNGQKIIRTASNHFGFTSQEFSQNHSFDDRFYMIGYVSGYYELDWATSWEPNHAATLMIGVEDGKGDLERGWVGTD